MTEQQSQSAVVEETREAVETISQPENNGKKRADNKTNLAPGAIVIAVAMAAGTGLYSLNKQQTIRQNAATSELSGQLAALQKAQESQKNELKGIIKQQADQLSRAKHEQETLTEQLGELQQRVAVISGNDAKTQLLAQADLPIKLAERRLWSDQDVTTATALLKSADASLADTNDPSLIDVRRAITDDVATLSAASQVDYDSTILKVNQLANQIDNLRLADNNDDDSPMDSDSDEFSSSIDEWCVSLQKSWQNFMDSFITIRHRDETAVPLLAPNQDIYLRENIRSHLLVAAQAVPCHQEETWKQSLDNVSTWVRAYYGTDDAITKAFLDEMGKLNQQNITMTAPETLQGQVLLEKLVQTRVRNLMAQPAITAGGAPSPAPATPAALAAPQGE